MPRVLGRSQVPQLNSEADSHRSEDEPRRSGRSASSPWWGCAPWGRCCPELLSCPYAVKTFKTTMNICSYPRPTKALFFAQPCRSTMQLVAQVSYASSTRQPVQKASQTLSPRTQIVSRSRKNKTSIFNHGRATSALQICRSWCRLGNAMARNISSSTFYTDRQSLCRLITPDKKQSMFHLIDCRPSKYEWEVD